jgi:hypothetical protein
LGELILLAAKILIRPKGEDGLGEIQDKSTHLTGLRSRNHSLKVCVFALAGPFLTFGSALDATLLLLLFFLLAGTFSLAFIHAFCLRA